MAAKPTKPFAVKGFNVTSPKGKALWCKVNEPDRMYNNKGDYSTSLVCDPNDPAVQKFIDTLNELRDKAFEETVETLGKVKAKGVTPKDVFTEELDQDGNETGNVIFKAKMRNVDDRTAKGDRDKIIVVDAKRQVMTKVPNVGNGSEIRIVCYANPYYMANSKDVGISLIWEKMQIIDLVEYSGGGGDDFDEEDGFVATPASPEGADFDDDDTDF